MWIRLLKRTRFNPNLLESCVSTARKEILVVLSIYLVWQLYRFFIGTQAENVKLFPLTMLVITISLLSLWLVARFYTFGNIIWLSGLLLAITLFLYIFRKPEIGLFYGYLSFLAVTLIGWPFVFVIFIFTAVIIYSFQTGLGIIDFSTQTLWFIFLSGAINGLLGWAATDNYLQVTSWSIVNYQKARTDLEEAWDERLAFKQLQEDLLHANRELTRLSERLKALNNVAEEAVRVKEEFVANVSHELRTPLNMIIGFCEMITQSPSVYGKKLPALLLADINAIQRNSQHLTQLVNDVLDLSQIDAGRMALSKQWVNYQDIIYEAVETVADFFKSRNLNIKVNLPEERIQLFCDRTRIREVILNLLSNAGRFTQQGGVEIWAVVDEQQMVFCLADTGPGIAPEDQKRLFEPFQQLDGSIRRKYGGSGLGLYISKQFVEMHGGRMWLESVVGKGTKIYFSLPIITPMISEETSVQNPTRWINPYQSYEPRTRKFQVSKPVLTSRYVILENGDTLERFFTRYIDNAETQAVRTFDEAIEVMKQAPAQAVILNTPPNQYSLAQVSEFIEKLPYRTPVMSCWIQGSDAVARSMGMNQYLVKPIDRTMLLNALEKLEKPLKTILMVEDNPEVLQLFSRFIDSGSQKYQVIRARDGQQALRLLRERKPDVMILDLVLDEMNGFDVLKEKNADPDISDIPVIVASSLDPTGSPIVSDILTITHKGGLSVRELINSIQMISQILTPQLWTGDLTSQLTPPG